MEKKNYWYCRFRGLWRVWTPEDTPHSEHLTKESARKEVYRLNGWQYKPSNNNA